MQEIAPLGLIAGNGIYPLLVARAARQCGVREIHVAAFENETRRDLADAADTIEWLRVGQLSRLLKYFSRVEAHHAIMAGQIAPKNLFELRPDLKALMLLSKLKKRNAETLFGGVAAELANAGVTLLPSITFLQESLPGPAYRPSPKTNRRL